MTAKTDKPKILVRAMEFRDTSEVQEIESECFSNPWSEKSIISSLEEPNSNFVVALCKDKIAGYAGMYKVLDEGYIYNVAVATKFRHMGVGNCLVSNLIDHCKENKLEFLSLEVRISNTPAIALYKNLGFQLAGERKNFYEEPNENALIMTKFFVQSGTNA